MERTPKADAHARAPVRIGSPNAASGAREEILECVERVVGQMEIGAAAVMRIGLAEDQAVFDQQLDPAQPGRHRFARSDRGARHRDALSTGLRDIEIEHQIPAWIAEQLGTQDLVAEAALGLDVPRLLDRGLVTEQVDTIPFNRKVVSQHLFIPRVT